MAAWKEKSMTEKVMIIIIIMLIMGIISRWGYIKQEVGSTLNHYFGADSTLIAK